MVELANPIGVMTRISEKDGAPTPFFIQQWNSQLAVNTYVFNEIVAGAGLVGGGSLVDGNVTLSMPPKGTAGTYGSSTEVPVITTDEQGRVVDVTLETITAEAALAVEDDGVAFGSFSTFNFVGANWSLTDAGAGELTVSVSESFTGVATEDDGVSVVSSATTFNFTGSGVTVTDAGGGQADIAITGGISGIATEDDGVSVVSSSDTLNFTGAGVTVTDGGGGQTNIAIAGGISGIATEDDGVSVVSSAITLNFTGAGVTVTDAGAGQADIAIAGGTSGIATEDDGVSVVASSDTLNFTGAGVVVTDGGGGQTNIAIAGGSGGISGVAVEDDGVSVETEATTFNFTGAGVVVTDAGSGQVDVAIAGGGGGGGSGEYTTYALTNPGFEEGDLTGWTQTTSGQWTVSSGSFFGTSGPDTGTYYARTLEPVGAADPLYQDITLSGATNGGEVVEITYSLSWPIGLDLATVSLVFFDASDTEIGRRDHRPFGDDIGSSPWYRYVLTAIMPADVTTVRVQVGSINREGSRAASAVDSFSSLSVSAAGGASGGGATAQWFKGNGYRRHIITATASNAFSGDPNRSLGATPDNSFYWNGSGTRSLTWDFKEDVNLTGVALVQSSATSMGTWQMSYSTDNVSFTDVGDTFAWGTTATTVHEFENTNEARYWRVTLVSGSTSSGPWQHLHLFKLRYASEG